MALFPHATPLGCLAALALLALVTGCASTRVNPDRHLRQALDVLTRTHTADARAAAALIDPLVHGKPGAPDLAGRLQLIDEAVTLAPDRPDLVWLALQACRPVAGCDPVPFEMRLRSLDPENGTGWLGALGRAYRAHDDDALDELITDVGHSARVDIYWTPLASRLGATLAATHELSQSVALVTVIGALAAIAVPEYQSASEACQGERLERPGVLDACRALAASFERGDSLLTAGLGTAIDTRLWPEGSPEWNRAVSQRRLIHYWLQMEAKRLDPSWDAATARTFARLLADHRREQDVFSEELNARGIPPIPPDTWVDPTPN
jgi:hypothetical protein